MSENSSEWAPSFVRSAEVDTPFQVIIKIWWKLWMEWEAKLINMTKGSGTNQIMYNKRIDPKKKKKKMDWTQTCTVFHINDELKRHVLFRLIIFHDWIELRVITLNHIFQWISTPSWTYDNSPGLRTVVQRNEKNFNLLIGHSINWSNLANQIAWCNFNAKFK